MYRGRGSWGGSSRHRGWFHAGQHLLTKAGGEGRSFAFEERSTHCDLQWKQEPERQPLFPFKILVGRGDGEWSSHLLRASPPTHPCPIPGSLGLCAPAGPGMRDTENRAEVVRASSEALRFITFQGQGEQGVQAHGHLPLAVPWQLESLLDAEPHPTCRASLQQALGPLTLLTGSPLTSYCHLLACTHAWTSCLT